MGSPLAIQRDDEVAWTHRLRVTPRGEPESGGFNVGIALMHAPEFAGKIRFNVVAKQIEWAADSLFANVASDVVPTVVADVLLNNYDLRASYDEICRRLYAAARAAEYDPVADYLRSLRWDGTPRIESWLRTYCYAETMAEDGDVAEHVDRVGKWWLISAVARALYPGCQADSALVLKGAQGAGKSKAARVLGGAYYSNRSMSVEGKDGRLGLGNNWIVELAELSTTKGASRETLKDFMSTLVDSYRVPYGRTEEKFPRRCVFVGTTNDDAFLDDPTGSRRWWCVTVGEVDLAALARDRDQLWAEAVAVLEAGRACPECRDADPLSPAHDRCPAHRWWPSREELELVRLANLPHEYEDPMVAGVLKWWAANKVRWKATPFDITTDLVAEACMPGRVLTRADLIQAGTALRTLGFEPGKRPGARAGGARRRTYLPPRADR